MSGQAQGEVDRLVNEYGRAGKWTELAAVLDRMDRLSLPTDDQVAWYQARGIVEFRTNHRASAREIFEEGVRQVPAVCWPLSATTTYGTGWRMASRQSSRSSTATEDIRTLARAELFHRYEMRDREDSALAQFRRRQAVRFEPRLSLRVN